MVAVNELSSLFCTTWSTQSEDQLWERQWEKRKEITISAHYTEEHPGSWKSATTGHSDLGVRQWVSYDGRCFNSRVMEVMLQKRFTREAVGWDFKVFSSLVFCIKKNSENKAEEIFNFNIVLKIWILQRSFQMAQQSPRFASFCLLSHSSLSVRQGSCGEQERSEWYGVRDLL